MEKAQGRSRYGIYGRFNEAYNVERRRDIYLDLEMEPAKFIQVSSALSIVKRSEPTFPCWMPAFPGTPGLRYSAEKETLTLSVLIISLCFTSP